MILFNFLLFIPEKAETKDVWVVGLKVTVKQGIKPDNPNSFIFICKGHIIPVLDQV